MRRKYGMQCAQSQDSQPGMAAQRSKSIGLPRWKIIPLMLDDPPSTLPRAWYTRRPPSSGSGSDSYCQS